MKINTTFIISLLLMICTAIPSMQAQQPAFQDDDLSTSSFTLILKEEWIYLRDAVDQFIKETEQRSEFETTPEFQARVARTRQTFLNNLNSHIRDNKMDSRVFGVWFKASLVSYDADGGIYTVKCKESVEAPNLIPTVDCYIPDNPYAEMTDSISKPRI
jgi:hypothetical protein